MIARSLQRGDALSAVLALAIGYGAFWTAAAISDVFVDALAQHVVDITSFGTVDEVLADTLYGPVPERLYFSIGGTVFFYGELLTRMLAFLLVGLAALTLWRLRARRLAHCPHCLSQIPREAAVRRECSLEVAA